MVVTLPPRRTSRDSTASEAPACSRRHSRRPRLSGAALQSELKRVGCYDGDVNGVWNARSRAAMKAFTERVNATLPVDNPDQILLALVQGHRGRACEPRDGERPAPPQTKPRPGHARAQTSPSIVAAARPRDAQAGPAAGRAETAGNGGRPTPPQTQRRPRPLRHPIRRGATWTRRAGAGRRRLRAPPAPCPSLRSSQAP